MDECFHFMQKTIRGVGWLTVSYNQITIESQNRVNENRILPSHFVTRIGMLTTRDQQGIHLVPDNLFNTTFKDFFVSNVFCYNLKSPIKCKTGIIIFLNTPITKIHIPNIALSQTLSETRIDFSWDYS